MKKHTPVRIESPRRAHTQLSRPRRTTTAALIGVCALLALPGVLRAADPAPLLPGTWTLEFQDEFDGASVDGAKWRLGSHHAGIAGAAGTSPQNITVADGKLKLKAEQRAVTYGGTNYNYATGEISTFFNHRQQHGYIEARIKYPAATGLWPAFWLMPDRANYGWPDAYRRSYLKFDLTGVNPGAITSATLRLKVSSLQTGGTNNLVVMKLADDTWSESAITWNNKPVPDPVWLAQKWNNLVSPGDVITIDLTDHVAQEMAGDKKISLVLADTFMRAKLLAFHSSEATNAADRPQLVINGVAHTATEDATVRRGTLADTNYGSAADLGVKDDWGDTATTFNGGMEVDIMESLGIWGPDVTQHALHWDGYGASHKSAEWHDIDYPATPDGFHTYGVYWEPGLLAFYIDGVKTVEYANPRVMSVPPDDSNLIANFHLYEPHAFTHQGAGWVSPWARSIRGLSYPPNRGNLAALRDGLADDSRAQLDDYAATGWNADGYHAFLQPAVAWAREHRLPLICTEFGVYKKFAPRASRLAWLRDVSAALSANGIGWTMWDYAGDFAVVVKEHGIRVPDHELVAALGLISPSLA